MGKPLEPALAGPARQAPAPLRIAVRCTYCHDALGARGVVFCGSCLAGHHAACHAEHGRCAGTGCGETRVLQREEAGASGERGRLLASLAGAALAASLVLGLSLGLGAGEAPPAPAPSPRVARTRTPEPPPPSIPAPAQAAEPARWRCLPAAGLSAGFTRVDVADPAVSARSAPWNELSTRLSPAVSLVARGFRPLSPVDLELGEELAITREDGFGVVRLHPAPEHASWRRPRTLMAVDGCDPIELVGPGVRTTLHPRDGERIRVRREAHGVVVLR